MHLACLSAMLVTMMLVVLMEVIVMIWTMFMIVMRLMKDIIFVTMNVRMIENITVIKFTLIN